MITAPIGQRKYRLGGGYLIACFAIIETAILTGDAAIVGAAAAACASMAPGVGIVIWGNVGEHKAKSGGGE